MFEQEYRARFVDDTGGVFQSVREHVEDYGLPVAPGDCKSPYAIGEDFARLKNWTVAVVLDGRGHAVTFERLQEMS